MSRAPYSFQRDVAGPVKADALPTARPTPRRGLRRTESAIYIGVSPSKFDDMVADGRMPPPRTIDGRVVWDLFELDDAFSALPHKGEPAPGNPWDRVR